MFEENLQKTLERWKLAFHQYSELKADAEQAVVRAEWTSAERYSLLPFHFERFPGRGRILKEIPTSTGQYMYYGFDAQSRVRLQRSYFQRASLRQGPMQKLFTHGSHPQDLYSETFYTYSADRVDLIEYSVAPHIPLKVQQVDMSGGQVVFHSSFSLNGYTPLYSQKGKDPEALYEWLGYNGRFKTAEQYVYEGSRLAFIQVYCEAPGAAPWTACEILTYTEAGKLLRVDELQDGDRKRVIYQKRPRGQTFGSLRQAAVQAMVRAITGRLSAAGIHEKLYAVELYYRQAIHHFPPAIIPVPDSYRQELLKAADPDALRSIFIPLLKGNDWFLEISDPSALEICQLLEQEIQTAAKWNTATTILREVAAALTRQDWSNILNVTPDFVVYALDPELEGNLLSQVLGASVSKEQLRQWQDKGWLA